jgi:putative ABC transport system substrate-binding protein
VKRAIRLISLLRLCVLLGQLVIIQSAWAAPLRVGLIIDGAGDARVKIEAWLRERLREHGYVEGRDISFLVRGSDGDQAKLPGLMSQMVDQKVDIIVSNGTPAALAARRATSTIPIVVLGMADPVRAGLVASLSHPGSNLTGMSMGFSEGFSGKWLEILQEVVPRLGTVAAIVNPSNPMHRWLRADVIAAAAARGLKVHVVEVTHADGLDKALKEARKNADGALIFGDASTMSDPRKVASMAQTNRLPVVYGLRYFVEQGGLISYAPDVQAQIYRVADYVDMILKGARPAALPVEEPTKFELVVNLKTAKALGITIPESILLRADEVIR